MLQISFSYLCDGTWALHGSNPRLPGVGEGFEYRYSKLNLHAKHKIVLKSFYRLLAHGRYSLNMSCE